MWLCPASQAQDIPKEKILYYDSVVSTIDTTLFGSSITVKVDNDTLRLAFQQALSYYPELWGKKITLQYGKAKTSMTSRPKIFSLIFCKRSNRSYKITISNKEGYKPAQLVNQAPFNALVGVLGHELAHVLDYSDRSACKVIRMGAGYLGKNYRRRMEHFTDSLAMSKGLQWQVYHYSHFVVNEADIDNDYRRYKLDIYLSPEEVRKLAVQLDSLQLINQP